MFVVSLKTSRVKIILFSVFLAIIALSALLLFNAEKTSATVSEGGISLRASDYKERERFLSQFGWDFDIEPYAVKEVTIPWEFDDVYIEYNAVQKRQGFDLEKYKGEIVKKWTYNINNYPGYENKDGEVQANLLIYNGNVIGADITILGKKAEVHTIMSD